MQFVCFRTRFCSKSVAPKFASDSVCWVRSLLYAWRLQTTIASAPHEDENATTLFALTRDTTSVDPFGFRVNDFATPGLRFIRKSGQSSEPALYSSISFYVEGGRALKTDAPDDTFSVDERVRLRANHSGLGLETIDVRYTRDQ